MTAIKTKDIYAGKKNPFDDVTKGALEFLKVADTIIAKGKELGKVSIGDIKSNPKEKATDYRKLAESIEQVNKVNKNTIELEKRKAILERELAKTQQQNIKTEQQKLKLTTQQSKENERLIKSEQKQRKELEKQNSAYQRLNKQLTEARKKAKDIGVTYGVTSKQFRNAAKDVLKLDVRIKNIDKSLGLSQREVGNYGLAFKKAGGNILGLAASFVSLRAGFRVVKDSIKTIADFEKAQDEVVAITGATNDEINKLEKNALKLGATTSKTAIEVSGLQKEFAKLGFTTDEILAATDATIDLSIAAGSDLADSAVVAASTIRGFGLDANETQRVVDVMAKSFTSSALDLEKFKVAMATVAPVARASGKTIEFTSARLSVLADAGIDASTAGTSLRNIFLELNKRGLTFEQGLQKINESTNKNVTALDLFGKRGATAALVLAENTEKAADLEDSYNNATGAAEEMARIMEDNLIGDTTKLSSAWDGFILGLNSGEGTITKIFRGFTQWLTNVISLMSLANKTYEEIVSDVKDDSLQEIFKADSDELDALTKKYSEFLDPIEASRKAIDDMILSLEKVRDSQKEQVDSIDKRIQGYEKLKNANGANIKLIDSWIEALQKQKVSEDANLDIINERINALDRLKLTTIETTEIIDESTKEELTAYEKLLETLKELESEKKKIDKGDDLRLFKKQTEINIVKEQIEEYEKFFKLFEDNEKDISVDVELNFVDNTENLLKELEAIRKKEIDAVVERNNIVQDLESEHYDSLIGLFFNYKNRKIAANSELTNEEVQQQLESNEQIQAAYQQLADTIIGIGNEILQSRISQLDNEISYLNQKINEQEQAINRELQKQLAGNASFVTEEEEKLKKLQAQREKDIREREKIQQKQEAINTLTQISELATAVATIINSAVSELGWAGVIAGLAAAAAAIIGFTTYKSEAQSAAYAEDGGVFERKGTRIESGKRHSEGGNRYSYAEFEQGEKTAVFSRKATKEYGNLIDDFTFAANNGKLSNDELEMYKYSLSSLDSKNVIINNENKELLSEIRNVSRLLSSQKTPIYNPSGKLQIFDNLGQFKKGSI